MKSIPTILLFMSLAIIGKGQDAEFACHLISGLFSFDGNAVQDSAIGSSGKFGKESGFSAGIAFQFKWITNAKWLVGVQVGYESLSSKLKTIQTSYFGGHGGPPYNFSYTRTEGSTILTYKFVSFYPFFGKRFSVKDFSFDFTGGLNLGICAAKGKAESSFGPKNDNVSTPPKDIDVRPEIAVTIYYRNGGVLFGYAYGLSNYTDGYPKHYSSDAEIYSRMLKFGLTFKTNLKKK